MSQSGGTLQIPPHQSTIIGRPAAVNQLASTPTLVENPQLKTQIGKPFRFRLPVELLRAIFEEYLRLDLPVQALLEVNRQWRNVALETQSLWRRLLLSADAIPAALRTGLVHACDSEYQTELVLKRSSAVKKLEVTFVLGPKESDIPAAEERISPFKAVGHTALHKISSLCGIANPEMTLDLVMKPPDGAFQGTLSSLESLMIATAKSVENLHESPISLMGLIDDPSAKLKFSYLENVNKDCIIHTYTKTFGKRIIRPTNRNEFDSLDAKLSAYQTNLKVFSLSGELLATPVPPVFYPDLSTKQPIEFESILPDFESPMIASTKPLQTQALSRHLLSTDAIPGSLHTGSLHLWDSEHQAELILKRSGAAVKLEVTFVLGPKESDISTAEQRIRLFKTVEHTTLHRISFLCIVVNPEMTFDLVTKSLESIILPNLESLMIANTEAVGGKTLMTLMELIDDPSTKLHSLYLENVNKKLINHASTKAFWKRLTRITIGNEFDSLDAELFSRPTNLEFFSFSGELVATPSPTVAHLDSSTKHLIEFPELKWLRVSLISMGTLARLHVPKLHTMSIDCVQGAYPAPAPPPGEILIPALKVLQIATVNPTLACINAPEIDTLCLSIPALKQADADHVLKSVFHGGDGMMKPKHLTLRAPVHDKHLLAALRVLGEKLISLELDSQMPFSKTFWMEMTPPAVRRGLLKTVASSFMASVTGNSSGSEKGGAVGGGRKYKPLLLPELRCLVVDLHKNSMDTGESREIRVLLDKFIEERRSNDQAQTPLHAACKWHGGFGVEEIMDPPLCVSCADRAIECTQQNLAQSDQQPQPRRRVSDLPRAMLRGLAKLLLFIWPKQLKPKSMFEPYTRDPQASYNYSQDIIIPSDDPGRNVQPSASQLVTENELTPTSLIPDGLPLKTERVTLITLRGLRKDIPDLSGHVTKRELICISGYSKVYRGTHDGRTVAIKDLFLIKSEHTTTRKFRRELSIWWQLQHPNIVPLCGYLQHNDGIEISYSLVSEWADGGSAAQYIHHQGLTMSQRITLIVDIIKAIKYLHDCGIVHADIKPQNVLINANGVGQLCDFGLSRLQSCWEETSLTTTTPHTGSPRYLAYELARRAKEVVPTTASDIYAFGCVAHEVLYKQPPHASLDSHFDVSQAIRNRMPPAEKPLNLEPALYMWWDLFECCWDIDPSSRMTAADICDYLE